MTHRSTEIRNYLAGGHVDRAAERRKDEAWIAARLRDPRTRFAPVWAQKNLFAPNREGVAAVWLSHAEAEAMIEGGGVVFLGEAEGAAYFALALEGDDPAEVFNFAGRGEWDDLKQHGTVLAPAEAGLLAFARGMAWWHARHRFCGVCGAPTESCEAGHVRACTNPDCGAHHFPRTDPAVIMLVRRGERALLGRQRSWLPGLYATLAGFVEPGESLEDAVAREVREETGVRVTDVRYHSSQPWPFPASLMVGFTAEGLDEEITTDDELEDARWFSREDVRRGLEDGTFRLSPPFSISRRLIADWLGE